MQNWNSLSLPLVATRIVCGVKCIGTALPEIQVGFAKLHFCCSLTGLTSVLTVVKKASCYPLPPTTSSSPPSSLPKQTAVLSKCVQCFHSSDQLIKGSLFDAVRLHSSCLAQFSYHSRSREHSIRLQAPSCSLWQLLWHYGHNLELVQFQPRLQGNN